MLLTCTQGCGGAIFRALDADLVVDSGGDYVEHRILQPAYACLNCGSPALDLGQVPSEMAAESEADRRPPALNVLCPVCETPATIDPGQDCPNCGAPLEV